MTPVPDTEGKEATLAFSYPPNYHEFIQVGIPACPALEHLADVHKESMGSLFPEPVIHVHIRAGALIEFDA